MRKSAPVAFLLAGFMVVGTQLLAMPAQADDDEDEGTSEVTQSPEPQTPQHKHGDEKRKELEEKYGKQGKLSLPPLVIRPKRDTDDLEGEEDDDDDNDEQDNGTQATNENTGNLGIASTSFIAINPMTAAEGLAGGTGRAVNPHQNTPIDISNVRLTRKTPAEVFIQASQVGLFAMAAGALVLGLITASRAIRRK